MPDVITFTSEGDDPSGRRRQGVDRHDAAPVRPAQGCELGVPPDAHPCMNASTFMDGKKTEVEAGDYQTRRLPA